MIENTPLIENSPQTLDHMMLEGLSANEGTIAPVNVMMFEINKKDLDLSIEH